MLFDEGNFRLHIIQLFQKIRLKTFSLKKSRLVEAFRRFAKNLFQNRPYLFFIFFGLIQDENLGKTREVRNPYVIFQIKGFTQFPALRKVFSCKRRIAYKAVCPFRKIF